GPEQVVVLDPVALEHPGAAVVHAHREVHDDLVLGLREDVRDVLGQIDRARGGLEVALNDLEELVFVWLGRHGGELLGGKRTPSVGLTAGSRGGATTRRVSGKTSAGRLISRGSGRPRGSIRTRRAAAEALSTQARSEPVP